MYKISSKYDYCTSILMPVLFSTLRLSAPKRQLGVGSIQLRKSCDYCVRMKRGCDGGTPCELCVRRNKECIRSVKKRSGPAKVCRLKYLLQPNS